MRCKRLLAILADDNPEREISHALVPYPPLYQSPSFRAALDRFRQEEQGELRRRGADHVIHNVGIFDNQHSSEEDSADREAVDPEDLVVSGPSEHSIGEEVRLETPYEEDNQPDDNRPLSYTRQ